ncbi:EAL domain-containing protein [Siminovitchia sp. 179-K 8D1 HS]|uniref:sensor domain-containing protein n=1 Tax=Siminovitchia sp. 179-K 8D1 HS TaxID=3142385 RepID=UPI0039A2C4CE
MKEIFTVAFQHSENAICLFDNEGSIIFCNQKGHELLNIPDIENPDAQKKFHHIFSYFNMDDAFGRSVQLGEASVYGQDNQLLNIELTFIPLTLDDGLSGIVVIIKPNKYQQFDYLTGIQGYYYAKKYINQRLSRVNQQDTFAFLYVNIDELDHVMDVYGLETGEKVAKSIVSHITGLYDDDDIVFRIEENTLGILLKRPVAPNHYISEAKKLINHIETPFNINHHDIHFTATIGGSVFPYDGKDFNTLFKKARIALKQAKELGNGNFQFYLPEMKTESLKKFELEADLLKAIQHGELYVEYQPKIDIHTQMAIGAEALIRWEHPVKGNVSPAEFIPAAEENGKIIQLIDDFVIRTVCRQIRQWKKEQVPFKKISINLSAKSFLKNDLIDRISHYLEEYSVNPSSIEVELTESSLLQSSELIRSQLAKLAEMGISIALDDYGTGFSSIHYLKKYPFHTIKIDRSFIHNIVHSAEDAMIVKFIIELSKGLRKKVIAEGVETSAQYQLLKKYGCNEVQGFLFSRAIAGKEIANMFLKENAIIHDKNMAPRLL